MTHNRETKAAWRYHDFTKHSYQSIRADRHYLDWSNQPSPFKIYPSLEPIPLPRSLVQTLAPALEVIATSGTECAGDVGLHIDKLAQHVEVSRPGLSISFLGQRNDRGERACDGGRARTAG